MDFGSSPRLAAHSVYSIDISRITHRLYAEALKMKDIMDRHEPLWNFTFRYTDGSDQFHEFQLSGRPVFDATGKFTGYRGTGSVTRIETKASMAGHGLQNSGSS